MKKEMNTMGEKILNLRIQKRLSQNDLGNRLGVARQTVARWEAGEAQPNLEDIERMCEIFNVPINYFLNRKQEAEVAAENSGEQPVSEPVSEEMATQTKGKPWKPLVVAIIFTVLTIVPLFFSIIAGRTVFTTNQGDNVVSDSNFERWSFFVSLGFAILCFIFAIVGWVRFVLTKKR